MHELHYLDGYAPQLIGRIQDLLRTEQLGAALLRLYPTVHDITSARALYDYTLALKNDYLRSSPPLSKTRLVCTAQFPECRGRSLRRKTRLE
jgi:UTP pyrophosphatase